MQTQLVEQLIETPEAVRLKKRFENREKAKRTAEAYRRAGGDAYTRGAVLFIFAAYNIEALVNFNGWSFAS
jgi:hypothetical protein